MSERTVDDVLREFGISPHSDVGVHTDVRCMAEQIATLYAERAGEREDAIRFAVLAREVLVGMTIEGVDIVEEAHAICLGKYYEQAEDDDYTAAARVAVDAIRLRLDSPTPTTPEASDGE